MKAKLVIGLWLAATGICLAEQILAEYRLVQPGTARPRVERDGGVP